MQVLYSLDLSPNYFSGTIPYEIVDMGSILYLNLSNIPLNGRFPLDISFIKGIKTQNLNTIGLGVHSVKRSYVGSSSITTIYK